MGKQHNTVPNEPAEFPVQPEKPEIQQPSDPGEPQVPEEAPENIPNELPPDESDSPELNPDEFEK